MEFEQINTNTENAISAMPVLTSFAWIQPVSI